tara:strand:- start:178 stop:777 length:600 start_codon:yes stop_codon:yes gene_type:complete
MTDNESLKPLDYVILGLIRNGIRKFQAMQNKLTKTGQKKVTSSFNKLMKLGYVKNHPDDGWLDRNLNPTLVLSDKGKKEVETKIDQLREEWNKLVLLYENKDKEKLRQGMDSNRMNFPFMMLMGLTSGMMMGNMLGMNQMNTGDYMQGAYDQGYADGMGDDGFMDGGGEGGFMDGGGEGGFMDGGGEGGFMDGGMDVGF